MKLRKVMFSFALVASLAVGNTTAFAQDIMMETKTATGSAISSFDVDADVIGGGIVVSIPSSLDLAYNAETKQYICEETVSAKGLIDEGESLTVTVDTEIIYTHTSKEDVSVVGTVDFGIDGTETWTADEMAESLETLDSRGIVITVDAEDLEHVGSYSTEMFFDITIQ